VKYEIKLILKQIFSLKIKQIPQTHVFPRFFFFFLNKYCSTQENNLQISNKSIMCIALNNFHTYMTYMYV